MSLKFFLLVVSLIKDVIVFYRCKFFGIFYFDVSVKFIVFGSRFVLSLLRFSDVRIVILIFFYIIF